ncbi:MAG: DUF1844 domain-containing protein [Acidobacteriota bacterium]|nr:DUF1844 domain-containing protein [Acidobacteriota bacterium]
MEKEKKPDFVVTDRRKFTEDGALRQDAAAETKAPEPVPTPVPAPPPVAEATPAAPPAPEPFPAPASVPQAETGYNADSQRGQFGGQKMEFIHLLDMLVQTAMMYAGAMDTGTEHRVDIVGLRQMIDLVGVLDQKTKGNLTEQEKGILENTIFQLRMTYMEIVNMIDKQAMENAPGAPKK